jgi:serine/threonine protein kinase/tetratricopeptide (TPR) repeat protein
VIEKIGEGGMGVVYQARDTRLKRTVALKFLNAGNSDSSSRRRFLREAQAASALNHPNIISIFDIGETADAVYIVMEYVQGRTLAQMIPRDGLPPELALSYARQICEALSSAHQAGVVHRDLKPGNIMIGPGGRLKILDFGLAKVEESQADDATATMPLTVKGGFLGTVSYAAPEQALGREVDSRADIFSFGILLHEMLTGRRPFQGASAFELMHEIAYGEPKRLRAIKPELPAGLEAVILKSLEKRPAQRHQTMEEVLAGLSDLDALVGSTAPAAPATAPAPASRALSRPPSGQPGSAADDASIAVLPFLSLSSDPDDAYLATGIASDIIRALTGVPRVRVASQAASFRFQGVSHELSAVADALHVRYAVTGSLRRAGSRIRVIAELADAEDGTVLWSQTYDRGIEDLFAVQEEIAHAVAGAVSGQLLREHASRASYANAESLDAFGLVHKAYHFLNQAYTVEGISQGIELLHRALELAPDYAVAHAFLGLYLIQRVVNGVSTEPASDRSEALAAVERALLLAPNDAQVLENAGLVMLHCGRYERSVQALRRAVKLAPFNMVAWGYLGLALGWGGDGPEIEEGEQILARLIRDTPDHPSMPYWLYFHAGALTRQRRFEEALDAAQRANELQPRFILAMVAAANILGHLGRGTASAELIGQVLALNPNTNQDAYLAELRQIGRSEDRIEPHVAGLVAAGIFKA